MVSMFFAQPLSAGVHHQVDPVEWAAWQNTTYTGHSKVQDNSIRSFLCIPSPSLTRHLISFSFSLSIHIPPKLTILALEPARIVRYLEDHLITR